MFYNYFTMSEAYKSLAIWKEYEFNGKYGSVVPEGESSLTGPCLRNALFQAGIFTDLPHWTRGEDIESICRDLGLTCLTGEGKKVTLSKKAKYVVGFVTGGTNPSLRVGHYEYTENIQSFLKRVNAKNVFAYIEIPNHS